MIGIFVGSTQQRKTGRVDKFKLRVASPYFKLTEEELKDRNSRSDALEIQLQSIAEELYDRIMERYPDSMVSIEGLYFTIEHPYNNDLSEINPMYTKAEWEQMHKPNDTKNT